MRHLKTFRYVDTVARVGSIRGAADSLAITGSALNRRILALEEELGVAIFERLPHGVRPSTAGELLLQHIRTQFSDIERLRSQIADLSGVRRGHVAIASSQAPLSYLLPEQVAGYRAEYPGVSFALQLRDRTAAAQALLDHSADLAIAFEPAPSPDFHPLLNVRQRVHAVMSATHPLAAETELRLRDCLACPIAVPAAPHGVRHLLEAALAGSSRRLEPVIESDSFEFLSRSVRDGELITFQIPVGLADGVPTSVGADLGSDAGAAPAAADAAPRSAVGARRVPTRRDEDAGAAATVPPGLVARPLAERDVPAGTLSFGQLRGRTLPVAAARFAESLSRVLAERYA